MPFFYSILLVHQIIVHFDQLPGGTHIINTEVWGQHFKLRDSQIPSVSGIKVTGPVFSVATIFFDPHTPGRVPAGGVVSAVPHSTHNAVQFVISNATEQSWRFSRIPVHREVIIAIGSVGLVDVHLDYTAITGQRWRDHDLKKLAEQRHMDLDPPPGETGHVMAQRVRMGDRN